MPAASKKLQDKFFPMGDDLGQSHAEELIIKAGGTIDKKFFIHITKEQLQNQDVADAVDYMLDEWDYGLKIEK